MTGELEVVWNGVNDGRDGDLLGVPRYPGRRFTPEIPTPMAAPKTVPAIRRIRAGREEVRARFAALFPDRPLVDLPSAPTAVAVLAVFAARPTAWLSVSAIAAQTVFSHNSVNPVVAELRAQGCVDTQFARVLGGRRPVLVYRLARSRQA